MPLVIDCWTGIMGWSQMGSSVRRICIY